MCLCEYLKVCLSLSALETAILHYHSFFRPDGVYWDQLQSRSLDGSINNIEDHNPKVYIKNETGVQTSYSLPVYGLHHPNRSHFGLYGGACPALGGDFSTYPWGNPGGWWPSMLQEITPICDAFLVDVRTWANLWNMYWSDPKLG